MSRLRERNGDDRPHFVICGADALVYTLAEELVTSGHRIRLTVITPPDLRPDVPDFDSLRSRGVRVITAARLDERTFGEAGLDGADALALVMPDDMVNLHAALCARAVEGDLRLVIRMFNTGLAQGVRPLFADCAVLSDANDGRPGVRGGGPRRGGAHPLPARRSHPARGQAQRRAGRRRGAGAHHLDRERPGDRAAGRRRPRRAAVRPGPGRGHRPARGRGGGRPPAGPQRPAPPPLDVRGQGAARRADPQARPSRCWSRSP